MERDFVYLCIYDTGRKPHKYEVGMIDMETVGLFVNEILGIGERGGG